MFEKATRDKVRFDYRGSISVEDLWDLSEAELNEIYVDLAGQKKDSETDSLINSREDKTLALKLDIVKHIFEVKHDEAKKAKDKAANRQKNQRILEIIKNKQDGELQDKSIEELQSMIESDEEDDS